MVKGGASENATDEEGVSALHFAARGKHLDILDDLIHFNAYINCQTINGETPLHEAARVGFLEGCQSLITQGAKLNIQTIVSLPGSC